MKKQLSLIFIIIIVLVISSCNAIFDSSITYGWDKQNNGWYVKSVPSDIIGELRIPSNINGTEVIGIGKSAFESSSLDRVYLNSHIKYIEAFAFRNSDILEMVDLSNVQQIYYGAFMNCKSLTGEVTIPSSVSKVFNGEDSLNNIFKGTSITKLFIPNQLSQEKDKFGLDASIVEIK